MERVPEIKWQSSSLNLEYRYCRLFPCLHGAIGTKATLPSPTPTVGHDVPVALGGTALSAAPRSGKARAVAISPARSRAGSSQHHGWLHGGALQHPALRQGGCHPAVHSSINRLRCYGGPGMTKTYLWEQPLRLLQRTKLQRYKSS